MSDRPINFGINELIKPLSTMDDIMKVVACQNDKFLQELAEGHYLTKNVVCENWKVKVYVDRTSEAQFKIRETSHSLGDSSFKTELCTEIECDFVKGLFGKCNIKTMKGVKIFIPLAIIEKFKDGDVIPSLTCFDNSQKFITYGMSRCYRYTFKNTRIKVVHD